MMALRNIVTTSFLRLFEFIQNSHYKELMLGFTLDQLHERMRELRHMLKEIEEQND